MMFIRPSKRVDSRIILSDAGNLVFWFGFAFLAPMVVSLVYGEPIWHYYLFFFMVVSSLGYIMRRVFRKHAEPFARHAILTIALTWFLSAAVGTIPFMVLLGMGPLDAGFESTAAITTTGLSIIPHPEAIPKSLLFWRTLEAWLGGIGIISVAFYGIMQSESMARIVLGEGHKRLMPNLVNSAREMFKIYMAITLIGVISLLLLSVNMFDAVNYSMSAISTTGSEPYSEGLQHYQALLPHTYWLVDSVLVFLMLMGSIGFVVHYRVFKSKNILFYVRDFETRYLFIILVFVILLISLYLAANNRPQEIGSYAFDSVSSMTGAGFQMNTNFFRDTGDFIVATLLVLGFVGGSQGSASGGVKVERFLLLLKAAYWRIRKEISPKETVIKRSFEGKTVGIEEVADVALYVFIYGSSIVIASGFLIAFGYGTVDSLFVTTLAQANAGLTTVPPAYFEAPVKLVLMVVMFLGRLEFWPILALLAFLFRR
ncbi:MAG: TrkH family potassium uptake protein [Candidatus Altiarchaeota archaeon]|nr:TrkH family potassium uptake protein [Candidatus Altiarchaeota archaeon]